MRTVHWDDGTRFDDPNFYWGDPSYVLEPGDPGYVPPEPPPRKKPRTKRKYMASNPTPTRLDELLAGGEDLCDGLNQHAVAIGVKQNTLALTRADLDALIATQNALAAAEGAQPVAYTTLRMADSNAKGFIARAIKVLSISLGNAWSDTGLPDQTVGVPKTQDGRFSALGGLVAYFTANAAKENAPLDVTAAIGTTLHTAVSNARAGVSNALSNSKSKLMARDDKKDAFRQRFRGAIGELEQLLEDDDPKWYDFGLSRPSDPATPGEPFNLQATAIGGGKILAQLDGARRANSFNFYKQVVGTDPEPVKVANTEGNQQTIEGLTAGATVKVTVAGVNDAGEGPMSEAVSVVVT